MKQIIIKAFTLKKLYIFIKVKIGSDMNTLLNISIYMQLT